MDFVRITRIATISNHGTFGVLVLNGEPFCCTLEPEWRMNKRNVSCIPSGQYIAIRYKSKKYGETWQVQNVSGRSGILFHAGNVDTHTEGCILLGQHYGKLYNDLAVLNSGLTFRDFMNVTCDFDEMHVTIINSF